MTVDQYWAQWELGPALWVKAVKTILCMPPEVAITVHFHHYLHRLLITIMGSAANRKLSALRFLQRHAFPDLQPVVMDSVWSHSKHTADTWAQGRLMGILVPARSLVCHIAKKEYQQGVFHATMVGDLQDLSVAPHDIVEVVRRLTRMACNDV
ncbi:hypothetical protein BDZ85DRAFT_263623 [Elsinoe ampelina]|uniref:Uncharacterized protein n=1 Tax=Elsinoe ampelina TaxID=302913 RepID=A0A6A6G9R6_9PEZI|nr:hypothetical protein BDZ85DRAFT_263623 [Elsinoe ampelina]